MFKYKKDAINRYSYDYNYNRSTRPLNMKIIKNLLFGLSNISTNISDTLENGFAKKGTFQMLDTPKIKDFDSVCTPQQRLTKFRKSLGFSNLTRASAHSYIKSGRYATEAYVQNHKQVCDFEPFLSATRFGFSAPKKRVNFIPAELGKNPNQSGKSPKFRKKIRTNKSQQYVRFILNMPSKEKKRKIELCAFADPVRVFDFAPSDKPKAHSLFLDTQINSKKNNSTFKLNQTWRAGGARKKTHAKREGANFPSVCSKGTLWRRRCWSFETKDQQRLLQTSTRSSFPKSLKNKTFLSYWLLPLIGLFTLVVPKTNPNVVMQNLSIGQNNLLFSQNLQTYKLINGPEAIASLAWAKYNTGFPAYAFAAPQQMQRFGFPAPREIQIQKSDFDAFAPEGQTQKWTLRHSKNWFNPLPNNMVRTNPFSSFNQLYKVLGFGIERSANNIIKTYPNTLFGFTAPREIQHNFFKLFLSKNFIQPYGRALFSQDAKTMRYQAHTFVSGHNIKAQNQMVSFKNFITKGLSLPMQTVSTFALKTNYSNFVFRNAESNLVGKHATGFFDFDFALVSGHRAETSSDKFKQKFRQSYVNNSLRFGFVGLKNKVFLNQQIQNAYVSSSVCRFPNSGFLNQKKPLPITSYKAALAFLNNLIYKLNWDTLRNTPFYTSNLGTKFLRSPKLDNKLARLQFPSTQELKNLDKILQSFIKSQHLLNNLIGFNNSIISLDNNFYSVFRLFLSKKQNAENANTQNPAIFSKNFSFAKNKNKKAGQKPKLVTSFNLGAYGLDILNSYMLFGAQNPQKIQNQKDFEPIIDVNQHTRDTRGPLGMVNSTRVLEGRACDSQTRVQRMFQHSFQKGLIKLHNPILSCSWGGSTPPTRTSSVRVEGRKAPPARATTSFSSKICSVQKTRLSKTNKTVNSEAKWVNRDVSKSNNFLTAKQQSPLCFLYKNKSGQNQRAIDVLEKNNISRIFSNYIKYLRKNLNKFIKLNKYNTTQVLYNYLPKKPIQYFWFGVFRSAENPKHKCENQYNTIISKTKHFKVTQDVTWLKAGTRTPFGRASWISRGAENPKISKNLFQNSIPIVLQHKKFFMLKPFKKSIVNRAALVFAHGQTPKLGLGAKRKVKNLQNKFYEISDNKSFRLVNYWSDTQSLIKNELLNLASFSKNKINPKMVWTNLQELNKYQKDMQKKRKAKKQRLEARRKTKRRRFYPRPNWLRLRLGLSLYKTKTFAFQNKNKFFKNSNYVSFRTRASAQKDYLNNYIQTLAKGNLKIDYVYHIPATFSEIGSNKAIILKDKLNAGLPRPAKTYQLAANTTAYNNIVYNLWLAAKKAKTTQSAVTNWKNQKNQKNQAKGNVTGLKELRATRSNFVFHKVRSAENNKHINKESIYSYKKKVLINQMLGKTTKQNLIKFKNTASYANFEEKSTQNIPKKDINKNSLRDFWIWLYNLTSTNLINKQIYVNNILNYFSIPIMSGKNFKTGQKSVGLGLDYTVSDFFVGGFTPPHEKGAPAWRGGEPLPRAHTKETLNFKAPINNSMESLEIANAFALPNNTKIVPETEHFLQPRVWDFQILKLANKPISLAFNKKTVNRVKWSLNKTNLWASTNQRINYWSTQKLRRQSKNNKTKYIEKQFKKQLNNLFTNLKLQKFFDVSLKNQTFESLRTNPAAANQNILKNYKIAIRSASQKMHQKQMKLSYITSGCARGRGFTPLHARATFSCGGRKAPPLCVFPFGENAKNQNLNNTKQYNYLKRFGGIEFGLSTRNSSNAFALHQGFIAKPSNQPWFQKTRPGEASFLKNSNSFDIGFDFSNITGVNGTRASVGLNSVNVANHKVCDLRQQNMQTVNSYWPITIFSLLLHFSALISLISISQIRCFMKFHFILIYKLSNFYLQIIYQNFKLFARLGAKNFVLPSKFVGLNNTSGKNPEVGKFVNRAHAPEGRARFSNYAIGTHASVRQFQNLQKKIGQDSKLNIAASKETSFAKLGFFKKAPGLDFPLRGKSKTQTSIFGFVGFTRSVKPTKPKMSFPTLGLNKENKILSQKIKASYQNNNVNPNYCKNLIYVSFLQKIIATKALKINNQSIFSFSKNGLPKANNNKSVLLLAPEEPKIKRFGSAAAAKTIYKFTNFLITFLVFFIQKNIWFLSSRNKEKSVELQRKRNYYTYTTQYNIYKNLIKVKNLNYEYIGTFKKGTYATTLKIVDTFEYFLRLIYGFFEKPAELTMDWIAYAFLVEWSSDLLTFTPENKDKQNWLAFSKLSRQTQPLLSIICASAIANLTSKHPSFIIFAPVGHMSSAGATFIFSAAISRFLYKRLMYLNDIFIEILNRPDTDLINRQKKGTLFWNIWSDILIKAADQYNINVPSLSNIKEEQNLLIDKFLSENQKTYTVRLNQNKFIAFSAPRKTQSLEIANWNARPFGAWPITRAPKGRAFQFAISMVRQSIMYQYKWQPYSMSGPNQKYELFGQKLLSKATSFQNQNTKNRLKAPFITEFVTYQSKETDLFLDYHPPKSLTHLSAIQYYSLVQQPIGTLVCQIYSGIFNKQISKNILVIGSILSQNGLNLKASLEPAELRMQKTLLIQALAGETEIKIITDNAQRYAIVNRGFAVGIKLLKEVFESLALNTPCLFLLEDIHLIGERRPLLISDHGDSLGDEMSKSTEIAFGAQRNGDAVHEKNKILYQYNRHGITHYQKPFKGDFSLSIPTNHFAFDLFLKQRNANLRQNTPISPLAYGINGTNQELTSENPSSKSNLGSSEKISSSNIRSKNSFSQNQSFNQHYSSSLQLSKNKLLSPPSTSPFTVLLLKEQKKLKPKKIVKELPWVGLPSEQFALLPRVSYSVRAKVAALADLSFSNMSAKFDMITDLLVIIDSVRGNRGFVVFATTHLPHILDPALRRPGRLDETIAIPTLSNLWNRWEFTKVPQPDIFLNLAFRGAENGKNSLSRIHLSRSGGAKDATDSNLINHFLNFSRYISNNFIGYHGTLDSLDFLTLDFLPLRCAQKTNILSPILTNLPRKLTRNKHANTLSMQLNKPSYGNIQNSFKSLPTCTNIAYYQMGRKLIRNWIWGTQSFGSTGKQKNMRTVWNILNFSPLYNNAKTNNSNSLLTENIEFLSTRSRQIKYKSIYSTTHIIKNTLIGLISGKFSELFAFKTMPILALYNKKTLVKAKTSFGSGFSPLGKNKNPKQNFQSAQSLKFNLLANQQHNNFIKQIEISNTKVSNQLGHDWFLRSAQKPAKTKIFGKQQITLYGIDQTWRAAMSLALSFVQKRYLYHKNLIVPKLLNFADYASLEEAPSPPFSNILIPAKRYENYKKVLKENVELNLYNNTAFGSSGQVLSNKLEKHLKQSFIQSIYKKGSKQQYLDKEFQNSKFQKLRFLETIPNANQLFKQTTNISWYYENKILKRHKNYLTNQWWNGQLIEHNAETLFLSDIDWRYTFYYANSDSKNKNWNLFGNKENKKQINQANSGTLSSEGKFENHKEVCDYQRTPKDILLDFPDSDQHYNPKHRRWILNSGYWSSWFDFDKKLQTEILNNFIFECFITSYNILNLNRELLDYSVTKYMQKGLIKEINMIGLVSRLGCDFQTFA